MGILIGRGGIQQLQPAKASFADELCFVTSLSFRLVLSLPMLQARLLIDMLTLILLIWAII